MVSSEEISRRLELKRRGLNPDEEFKKGRENVCPKCRTANLENAKFCIGCGSELNINSTPKINEVKSNFIICHDCGSENKPGSKFCIGCGNSLETVTNKPEENKTGHDPVICPECNFENNQVSKFCISCGKELLKTSVNEPVKNEAVSDSVICPECQSENKLESKFCIKCGNSLKKTPSEVIEEKSQDIEEIEEEVQIDIKNGASTDDNPEILSENTSEEEINGDKSDAKTSVLDEIKKAKELLDMGAISEEEFEKIKSKCLEQLN